MISFPVSSADHLLILSTQKESWTNTLAGKVILLLVAALFGFIASYLLETIKRRREPQKRMSWDVATEQGVVAVSPAIREKVEVRYGANVVENLHAHRFRVVNSGNRVIKNQYVRLEFSESTTILDHNPDPAPPREIGVAPAPEPNLKGHEIRYLFHHLECGQEVSLLIMAAGPDVKSPKPYQYNEEGDVLFEQRDVARIREDVEHLQSFVLFSLVFLFVPVIFKEAVESVVSYYDLSSPAGLLTALIRLFLAIPLIPHIIPVIRVLQKLISRQLSGRSSTSVSVDRNAIIFTGGDGRIVGNVSIGDRLEDEGGDPPQ